MHQVLLIKTRGRRKDEGKELQAFTKHQAFEIKFTWYLFTILIC